MSTQVQYRRGSAVDHNTFTGALGEITVDTTNWVARIHDGATAGGYSLVSTTATQSLTDKTIISGNLFLPALTGNVALESNINPSSNAIYSIGTSIFRLKDIWSYGSTYSGTLYINNGIYWAGNGAEFTSTTIGNTQEITANASSGQNVGLSLATTGVAAGNYGSATSIPTIVVDSKGRVTSVTSNAVSTTITLAGTSGSGSVAGGGTLTVNGTTNQITTSVSSSTITIALATDVTAPGNLTVTGDLIVQGNTTTLNTQTLTVEDLNILVASGAASGLFADGAGLTVGGADARLVYKSTTDSWIVNKPFFSSGNLVANSQTASSSTTTGALVVDGGAGVTGSIYIGGIADIVNNTQATTTTTGALQVTGGASIANGNLWIGGSGGMAIIATGNIVPNSNLSIHNNLGSDTLWWNNFYGVSTQARYADLAENYQADDNYNPGTVLIFGGSNEVTISSISHDTSVAGVVSTNPAHLMNSALTGYNVLPMALQGRVPCQVQGPVIKGSLLVTSDIPGVAQACDNTLYRPGCIIGKSLEVIIDNSIKTIEIVIGRV